VTRIFKRMALRASLSAEETARTSGHSTPVGAAQDMTRHGADMAGAMLARYSRRLNARRSAKVAGLREQVTAPSTPLTELAEPDPRARS